MDRRELLKLFGMGTVIAPVIAGVASEDNHARLIEVPKVEIIQPSFQAITEWPPFNTSKFNVTVYLNEQGTDITYRLDCSAFMMNFTPALLPGRLLEVSINLQVTDSVRVQKR